jgi:hypothetical protein
VDARPVLTLVLSSAVSVFAAGAPADPTAPRTQPAEAVGPETETEAAGGPPRLPRSTSPWSHVRPQSREIARLVAEAAERSGTIRDLLSALEASDVVAYVGHAPFPPASDVVSTLTWVTSHENLRFVMIRLDLARLNPRDRIMWLGHELQHALEVASAPDVACAKTLAGLYRRIGWESSRDRFDTAAAHATGDRVRKDLLRRGT